MSTQRNLACLAGAIVAVALAFGTSCGAQAVAQEHKAGDDSFGVVIEITGAGEDVNVAYIVVDGGARSPRRRVRPAEACKRRCSDRHRYLLSDDTCSR